MKITKMETLCLSRMHEPERQWVTAKYRTVKADCAIVVVSTDEGVQGIGEACAYGNPLMIKDMVAWMSRLMVGRDPTDPAVVPHPNGRSRAYDCAVAGIDCALWDIKGKAAGKRVAELLTAKPLDRVRLYASSGCRYDWRKRPEQLIDETLCYINDGFTACKVRIGTDWSWDGVNTDRFNGLMRELSKAVDGRLELMVDGNQRLTEAQALEVGKQLDKLGFKWFEEPIPQLDVDGYARLNAALDLPVTGGEQWTTDEQFKPYLEKKAYAIVQPDMGWCGITEGMKIAKLAHAFGVDTCPHSWHNGLMCIENAHYVAALPNPRVLELCMIQGPLQWEILKEKPVIKNGWLELPEKPGLGVELAPDLDARFPYLEGSYAVIVER